MSIFCNGTILKKKRQQKAMETDRRTSTSIAVVSCDLTLIVNKCVCIRVSMQFV